MVVMGPPFTPISVLKPKRGVGSHVERLGPTGSHRVPPKVPRREELGLTGSHRARFGSHRREELGPTASHQYVWGRRLRDFGSRKCSCCRLRHSVPPVKGNRKGKLQGGLLGRDLRWSSKRTSKDVVFSVLNFPKAFSCGFLLLVGW